MVVAIAFPVNEYVLIKPPNIRGKFKILLLYYLKKEPMHGYALIKEIAKDFGVRYVPSPGIIYPALQELEKEGYIIRESRGRRILYKITEKGKRLLEDNMDSINFVFNHIRIYRAFTEDLHIDELLNKLVVLGVWYNRLSSDDKRRLKDEITAFEKKIVEMIDRARPHDASGCK